MTEQEARSLFRELFAAFPHMHDYISRVDTPEVTLNAWLKMLGNVQLCDAKVVVERWMNGEIEPPTAAWDLGILPQKIRAAANKVSDRRINLEHVERIKQEAARKRGTEYRYDNQGDLMRIAMYAGMQKQSGIIDDRRFREIIRYCHDMTDTPHERPHVPDELRELWNHKGRRAETPLGPPPKVNTGASV